MQESGKPSTEKKVSDDDNDGCNDNYDDNDDKND